MEPTRDDEGVEGFTEGEAVELGRSFDEGGESEGVGPDAEGEHLEEESEGGVGLGFLDVAGDDGSPGDDVFNGKGIEEGAGLGEVRGEFEVEREEGVGDEAVREEGCFDEVGVEVGAQGEGVGFGAGVEEGGVEDGLQCGV